MEEYSLSSISNNGSFLSFPMINKKQILLDWINTINEPLCLLVSEVDNLKDGKVFIEILKHFLQKENMLNGFIKNINATEKMNPIQRVLFAIDVIIKVNGNKSNILKRKFEKFYTNQGHLFKDEDLMLDYVALLRMIYEKELDNDYEEEHPQLLSKATEGNNEGKKVKEGYNNNNNEKKKVNPKMVKQQNYSLQSSSLYDDNNNEHYNTIKNNINNNNKHIKLRKYYSGNQLYHENNPYQIKHDQNEEENEEEEESAMNYHSPGNNNEQEFDEVQVDTKYNDCNEVIEIIPNHNNIKNDYHKYLNNNPKQNQNQSNTTNTLDQYSSRFPSQYPSQNQSQCYNPNEEMERINCRINKNSKRNFIQTTNEYSSIAKANDNNSYTIDKYTTPNDEEEENQSIPHFNTNYFPSTQTQLNSGTMTLCNTNATPIDDKTLNHIEIVCNEQFDFKSNKNELPSKEPNNNHHQKKMLNERKIDMTPIKQQQSKIKNQQIYRHNNNLNDFDISMISKKNSNTGSIDGSFYTQIDSNKIYNKRQKAEINMSRGLQMQNKLFKLDHKNLRIPYIKLALPTQPVIISSYNEMKKYQLIINPNRQYERQFYNKSKSKESYKNMKQVCRSAREDLHPLTNNNSNNDISLANNKQQQQKSNYNQTLLNELSLKQNLNNNNLSTRINHNYNNNGIINQKEHLIDDHDNDDISTQVPFATKNKIYSWLVDIGIIKEKSINLNDIPNICINGVLLCDLVNRCEGRNECIHGIIRKTTTKSQIQVNVNKVLVHLRSIEKFTSRHLWSNSQIVQGNSQIIWELLDDLYNFYSMKTKYVSKSKSKSKMINTNQQLQQQQSFLAQDDPLINLNLDELTPFNNNPTPRPKNDREPIFYNTNKKMVNNMKIIPSSPIPFPISTVQNQAHVPFSLALPLTPIIANKNNPIKQHPNKIPRNQSFDQLQKTPPKPKPTPLTRCNTNNNFHKNHNNLSILNTNNNQNNSKVNNTFYHNQSFHTQTANNNINNGFLLFEKSSLKRMKQNIEQISSLYGDS